MSVKVFIKRNVPKRVESKLMPLLRELRMEAMNQYGYISGETLSKVDDPSQTLVIGTWQSEGDWRAWLLDEERVEIQERIDELLGTETTYEIYKYT